MILELWLWAVCVTAILQTAGCPNGSWQEDCVRWGNRISVLFELFPETLGFLFVIIFNGHGAPMMAAFVLTTLACHALLRWLAPRKMAAPWFVLVVAGWFALSQVTGQWATGLLFESPPAVEMLRVALSRYFPDL